MSKVWLSAGVALVVAAALAACGSSDTTAPKTTGVSGNWTFQELLANAGIGLSCADSATITLTQTGQTVAGTYTQTGVCSQGSQTIPNNGNGSIVSGVVTGDSISFSEDGSCLYTGTITGSPAARMAGKVDCPPNLAAGDSIDITGTWVMAR